MMLERVPEVSWEGAIFPSLGDAHFPWKEGPAQEKVESGVPEEARHKSSKS